MTTLAGIGGLGTPELIVILGLAVLLFGATRIPQLARSMGKSISEFKKGMAEGVTEGEHQESSKDAKKDAEPAEKAEKKG